MDRRVGPQSIAGYRPLRDSRRLTGEPGPQAVRPRHWRAILQVNSLPPTGCSHIPRIHLTTCLPLRRGLG